jgi:hypothetical protein
MSKRLDVAFIAVIGAIATYAFFHSAIVGGFTIGYVGAFCSALLAVLLVMNALTDNDLLARNRWPWERRRAVDQWKHVAGAQRPGTVLEAPGVRIEGLRLADEAIAAALKISGAEIVHRPHHAGASARAVDWATDRRTADQMKELEAGRGEPIFELYPDPSGRDPIRIWKDGHFEGATAGTIVVNRIPATIAREVQADIDDAERRGFARGFIDGRADAQRQKRPPLRVTRTFAELEVTPGAYDEIATKLREAGYEHAFMDSGAIDMHGIALTLGGPDRSVTALTFEGHVNPEALAWLANHGRKLVQGTQIGERMLMIAVSRNQDEGHAFSPYVADALLMYARALQDGSQGAQETLTTKDGTLVNVRAALIEGARLDPPYAFRRPDDPALACAQAAQERAS